MELLNHMAGIKTVAVGYKGTGQALNAILSGEVQTFFISPLVGLPHIKAGKLRALAVTEAKRNPSLPDVPSIADTYPGYEQFVWHCVMVPAKTPKPIVEKLSKELIRIIKQPEIQQRFGSVGFDAVGSAPEELAALIKKEIATYAALVKQIGLQPQ
jgi:tripartite-type tricarboxylate transporter receptor subunit TctC